MKKVIITIVGRDRPGIVHKVSQVLGNHYCNIVEVSQTTLLGEFAGLFSVDMPRKNDLETFIAALAQALEGTGLAHWVKDFTPGETIDTQPTEAYVITLRGPDKQGIIPAFSGTIAAFDVNIDNLRAVSMSDLKAKGDNFVALVFEVSAPKNINHCAFRQALILKAEEFGMEVSLQHRDIFEAIHRL